MRGLSVAMAAVFVVLVMMSGPAPCQAQWAEIVPVITSQLTSLWQNNELQFMGSTCYYSQKPKFKRWQLYFEGNFSCPSWSKIKGSAETRSLSGVMTQTIENFLTHAKDTGLVSEDEAKSWLQGYQNK